MKRARAAVAARKQKRASSAPAKSTQQQQQNHANGATNGFNYSMRKRKLVKTSHDEPLESQAKKRKSSSANKPREKNVRMVQGKRKTLQKSLKTVKKLVQVSSSKLVVNGHSSNGFKSPLNCVDAKKPPKFSYVVEGLLAGMGRPTQHGHMQYLCDNGFKYLVTLTQNKPRAILEYPGDGLEWVHIPIQDESPPSLEQIKKFVALVDRAKEEKKSVAVHCAWGRGRTGTMLACYLAKVNDLTLNAAIEEIRRLRPGSVDTDKQKMAIDGAITYWRSIQ